MKKIVYISCLLLGVSSTWAAIFTDDFDRAGTSWSSDGSLIGTNWVYDALNGNWKINNNQLDVENGNADTVLYNTELQTISGNGTNFTVSLDVKVNVAINTWSGVAFNAQDSSNFYYMRIRGNSTANVQIGRIGTSGGLFVNTSIVGDTFKTGTNYTMTVSSSTPHVFNLEIKEADSGTVLFSRSVTDDLSVFTGGYAGVYQGTPSLGTTASTYDNFSVETAPTIAPTEITDDFNRPDTPVSADGGVAGIGWVNAESPSLGWKIEGNRLAGQVANENSVLYNNLLESTSGDGTNMTLSLDVKVNGEYWAGVAFNVQDKDNYYFLRFKGGFGNLQFRKMVGGADTGIASHVGMGPFEIGTNYTITVTSSQPYVYEYTVKDPNGVIVGESLSPREDLVNSYTGGYAGALQGTPGTDIPKSTFDNFHLTVAGPPVFGYGAWAATWGVDIGAEEEDFDSDELINLYEYGLGGDPTDPLDQGIAPELVFGGGAVDYIFPLLSDTNSGLSYFIELNSDLVGGTWSNMGYTITGTNVTGGDLDFVTNATGTVEDEKFIRLMIEQN